MEIVIVKTQEEFEQLGAFRKTIWIDELKWIQDEDITELTDKYDEHSTNIIAIKDGEIIGCLRITENKEHGLPIERNIDIYEDENTVEINRFAVSTRFRRSTLAIKLMVFAYKYLQTTSINKIICQAYVKGVMELYSKLGFEVTSQLFKDVTYINDDYAAMMSTEVLSAQDLRIKDEQLYKLYTKF